MASRKYHRSPPSPLSREARFLQNTVGVFCKDESSRSVPVSVHPELPREKISKRMVFRGLPLVEGLGVGRVFHYHDILSREIETRELKDHEISHEMRRILDAVEKVKSDLSHLRESLDREIGKNKAMIFDVQKAILDDTDIIARLETELRNKKINGEHVVRTVFRQLEQRFRNSGSAMLSDKALDIRDIGKRILRVMTGVEKNVLEHIRNDSVVFARRLLPSDTIHFTRKKPRAIVTEEGGPGSHSALIARAMGIPSLSKTAVTRHPIPEGSPVVVDANQGIIIINPTVEETRNFRLKIASQNRARGVVLKQSRKQFPRHQTGDVLVYANVNIADDVSAAVRFGCDGIGLYRTENIYMLASHAPAEETLYEELYEALMPASTLPITLRLADIGADKQLPYLRVGREHSSLLGVRGVRFLLNYPDFLETQVRVFTRLSRHFDISLLVPFVTTVSDMKKIRHTVTRICRSMKKNGNAIEPLRLGAMLETPLSVLLVHDILEQSDFIGIGTNDLLQFVTAADRESLAVSHYYQEGITTVIEMVGRVVDACNRQGKECYVCGELAGDSGRTGTLLDEGLKRFSVLPPLIPSVKKAIVDHFCTNNTQIRTSRQSRGKGV